MEVFNVLNDYRELIAIVVIPVFLWLGSIWYQNRQTRKNAQLDLFLKLMTNRKKMPITRDFGDALNTIDVVFQDNKKIRAAWRAYYDSLHPESQHRDSANAFLLDLLSEIATHLGYKYLKQTDIDRYYNPKVFGDVDTRMSLFWEEQIRVLLRSKSQSEGFSQAEYEEHIRYLRERGLLD